HSATISEEAIYVATLVDPLDPNGMVLRLSYPRGTWVELGTPTWAIVAAAAGSALAVMGLLAWLLQRSWVGPVRELAGAAERMTAGQWNVRVIPQGADDIRFFGAKLNMLAASAEEQLATLRHQRADLQALVDSLPDPILATDAQQRVILINAPAAALFDLTPSQALGKRVVGAVNDEAVLQLLDESGRASAPRELLPDQAGEVALPAPRPPLQRELRLLRNGQALTYQAVAMQTTGGGALLVLRDVSTMAGAVQMKTDFVANASHELRTPIAAIKIAFETLRDVRTDDPEQAERCIQIIDGHLRRLEEMLRDLLDLSRVERPDVELHVKPMKAAELFGALRATMGPVARHKGIELVFETRPDDDDAALRTDARLMNLVLKNLVENSIKFTPPGGRVTVRVDAHSLRPSIAVADTGIGIAPEHIDRVFERFYQVDPARSGSAGRGTGLGLAIVKHAVHALGGEVSIESAPGQGTTVTCLFAQTSPGPPAHAEHGPASVP
ncbi:MAG: HAMP domain-containing sensor histidine kinase, partial [Tepidisphaeraceae bacterium]